jgi:cyanate permease
MPLQERAPSPPWRGYHPAPVLKLLLISILLLTFLLPAFAARMKDPRRALISALVSMAFAELGYAFFLYVLFPRLV